MSSESEDNQFVESLDCSDCSTPEQLIALALTMKPDQVFSVDWYMARQIPVSDLIEAVAMSVGLNPLFANIKWAIGICLCAIGKSPLEDWVIPVANKIGAKRFDEKISVLGQFMQRLVIADANLLPYGTLPSLEPNDDSFEPKVRLTDFATWAEAMGWELPEEFPRKIPIIEHPEAGQQSNKTTIDLNQSFISPDLKVLVQAAGRFWENADPDDKGTHPTNKTVEDWLKQQGIEGEKAKYGASIIRPEWAAKGRRSDK